MSTQALRFKQAKDERDRHMHVVLTALLGVIVGWYLRHVIMSSRLARLESHWQANAGEWSDERTALVSKTSELAKQSSELEVELGLTTARFSRQLEQVERDHTAQVKELRDQLTTLEEERTQVADQLADVARRSTMLDGELRSAATRNRARTAKYEDEIQDLQKQVSAISTERDQLREQVASGTGVGIVDVPDAVALARRERDEAQQQLHELTARSDARAAQQETRLAELQARLAAVERERDLSRRHVTELARRAAATEAQLHVQLTMLQTRLRMATAQRGVPLEAATSGDDLHMGAVTVGSLTPPTTPHQQLDGRIHALLDRSEAHRTRYQQHLETLRHELAAAQARLEQSSRRFTPRPPRTPAGLPLS